MIARHDAERPFFFGADQGLFGIYHPPVVPATQAALLCPPLGQDHIRSHRLYRQLATVLAAAPGSTLPLAHDRASGVYSDPCVVSAGDCDPAGRGGSRTR